MEYQLGNNKEIKNTNKLLYVLLITMSSTFGLLIQLAVNYQLVATIIAIFFIIVIPHIKSYLKNSFDILEPSVWLSVSYGSMFLVRPLIRIISNNWWYRNTYYLKNDAIPAGLVALVGALGLFWGYYSRPAARIAKRLPGPPRLLHGSVVVPYAIALVLLGCLGYVVFLAHAGSAALDLLSSGIGGSTQLGSAYLYMAPFLVVPASLLLLHFGLARKDYLLGSFGVLGVGFLILRTAPSGQRLWLLLIIGPTIVYLLLRQRKRPRLLTVVLVLLLSSVVLAALRDLPLGGSPELMMKSITGYAKNPGSAIAMLFQQNDAEMFDGLSLETEIVPQKMPFRPGYAVWSLITAPIPRQWWPAKPYPAEGLLDLQLFGAKLGMASVAFSVLGGFFYDSGYIGVFLYSMIVGIFCRTIWNYYKIYSENELVKLIYASILPQFIVLMRGNPSDTLARMLFTTVPLFLLIVIIKGDFFNEK